VVRAAGWREVPERSASRAPTPDDGRMSGRWSRGSTSRPDEGRFGPRPGEGSRHTLTTDQVPG
jgi:hypothetical protein